METKNQDTEQAILEAAKTVFTAKGYAGAQMQEIADVAGINKALVHYYFRKKQQLFDRVFKSVLETLVSPLLSILEKPMPAIDKIETFINAYTDTLKENPYFPLFMLHELSANRELVIKFFKEDVKYKVGGLIAELLMESNLASHSIDPRQMAVNFISMLLFPFVGRDLLSQVFNLSPDEYNDFLEDRKKILFDLVKERLQVQ